MIARGLATREHARMKVNHLHLMAPDVPAPGGFLVEVGA
jgi:hypothetical protein